MGLFDFLHKGRVDEPTPIEQPQPQPTQVVTPPTGDFYFVVEDVFTITGRGTVVTGRVQSGDLKVNETVRINGTRETEVAGIEMFRRTLDYAVAGDNCGILLRGVSRDEVKRGDTLTK